MDEKNTKNFIDPTLTPQNAPAKGYEYIDDVIYDKRASEETMKEVMELVGNFDCKLGTSTHSNGKDPYFGLYIPKK